MKIKYLLMLACIFITACNSDSKTKNDVKPDNENIVTTKSKSRKVTKNESELPLYNIGITNIDSRPLVAKDEYGNVKGFDIDILNEIAHINNISFSYNALPNDLIFQFLEQDKVSLVANEVTSSFPNIDNYLVSKPYLDAYPITIVTKEKGLKELLQLKGMTVAVKTSMSEIQKGILEEAVKADHIKIIEVKSDWIAVQKVLIGEADVAIGNSAIMPYYVSQLSEKKLNFYIDHSYPKEEYRFLISKKNPELLKMVNSGIDSIMSDEGYQNIFKKWF